MNAKELIEWLGEIPPMIEVYVQTSETALEPIGAVRYDKQLGCFELLTKKYLRDSK